MTRRTLVTRLRGRCKRNPLLRQLSKIAVDQAIDLYWVGGGIRDAAMGRASGDLDLLVTTGSRRLVGILQSTWDTRGFSFRKRGVTTWRFAVDDGTVDLVLAERRGLDGDLTRRELTINAMAFSLREQTFHDPHGGLADLRRKRLRTIDAKRFREDPVRALRLARFHGTLPTFNATVETRRAAGAQKRALGRASPERIRDELQKLLLSRRPDRGLAVIEELGLLPAVLPELVPLQSCVAGEGRPDVWSHTLQTLRETCRRTPLPGVSKSMDAASTALLRWSLLLHDIAKPATLGVKKDGSPSFHGHEVLGEKMADACLRRLHASRDLRRDVGKLIRWHLRPGHLADGPPSRRGLRRLAHEAGPLLPILCAHAAADARGSGSPDPTERMERLESTLAALLETAQSLRKRPLLRPVTGNDVMKLCDVDAGEDVGRILREVEERVLEGRIVNRRQALAYLRTRKTAP